MRAESCEIKSIKVLANPKLTQKINTDSAECELAIQTSNAEKKDLCIIVLSNGLPLEPHNQYLHYKLKEGAETTSPSAHALLSFQRFLTERNQTYQSLTEDPKEGVVFAYADYLIDNSKQICKSTGVILKNKHGYSESTARAYLNVVIDFYKWLHRSGLFFITSEKQPFKVRVITKRLARGIDQDQVLGHINSRNRFFQIETTDLMKRFGNVQSTPAYKKLKPMTDEDKEIFINHIKSWSKRGQSNTHSLMFRLAIETGLRAEELITFPCAGIHHPTSEAEDINFTIGPFNGCQTKFNKVRTIRVPYELMLELNAYLHSQDRKALLNKRIERLVEEHRQETQVRKKLHITIGEEESTFQTEEFNKANHEKVPYLFVNANGFKFEKNTLQSKLSKARKKIKEIHPHWYYRMQDLRSTFATHWLLKEAETRTMIFDLLISELADLMGHNSTYTTQKYINFMNSVAAKLEFASRKNQETQRALKTKRKGNSHG